MLILYPTIVKSKELQNSIDQSQYNPCGDTSMTVSYKYYKEDSFINMATNKRHKITYKEITDHLLKDQIAGVNYIHSIDGYIARKFVKFYELMLKYWLYMIPLDF